VLAIVAAALIGILVASLLSSGKGDNNGQANTSSTTSLETTTTTPAPTTTTTTTVVTTTTTTPAGPTPAAYEQAVRDYYGLLPGNIAAAWSRMTPAGQQMSGGAEAYQAFWSGISSVTVLSAVASGTQVATALSFVRTDSTTSNESYVINLVDQNGQLMIDTFQKVA